MRNAGGFVSWAKLKDKVSGKEFYFFSVHFDHIGKVARHESALIMLANIKKIAGDSPAICVGDFNGTPDSEPIQILKSDGLLLDSREISKNTTLWDGRNDKPIQFECPDEKTGLTIFSSLKVFR